MKYSPNPISQAPLATNADLELTHLGGCTVISPVGCKNADP